MLTILIIIHVIVCIALILIVLLQKGKGADMGAAFGGGGSQTLFGTSGAGTFLTKATTTVAIIFMVTSVSIAYLSSHRQGKSIMAKEPVTQQSTAVPASAKKPLPAKSKSGGAQPPSQTK